MITWDDYLTNPLLQAGIGIAFGFAIAAAYCIQATVAEYTSRPTMRRIGGILFSIIGFLNIDLYFVFEILVKPTGSVLFLLTSLFIALITVLWADRIVERGRG